MELHEHFTVTLNKSEAIALKTLLGNQSHTYYQGIGLKEEQCEFLSTLYNALPFEDEED